MSQTPSGAWPESDQTADLLAAHREGDPQAAGLALERHRDPLRRMVSLRLDRRIQGRVDASDIVQEVMIEANRRLDAYLQNPSLPFHLWLRQMARDRIVDAHRRHRASEKRSVDREQAGAYSPLDQSTMDLVAQLSDHQLTPAAAATMRELQRRFEAALEQLDDPDREIVLMRHFEQLSNQDAAKALGLSEPAASMRYLRALRRVRALLNVATDTEDPRE